LENKAEVIWSVSGDHVEFQWRDESLQPLKFAFQKRFATVKPALSQSMLSDWDDNVEFKVSDNGQDYVEGWLWSRN
jgi:hypothetical protein